MASLRRGSQLPSLPSLLLLLCAFVRASADQWNSTWSEQILGYAQAAYCRDGLETWSCGTVCSQWVPGLFNVSVIEDSETHGLAFVGFLASTKSIVVSFRGTQATSLSNWWSDLSSIRLVDAPPTLCPAAAGKRNLRSSSAEGACQVGSGFLAAYTALRDRVVAAVDNLIQARSEEEEEDKEEEEGSSMTTPFLPVIVTGHSLGAALANLAAVDLQNHFQNSNAASLRARLDTVVTYGCPRTGDAAWAEHFNRTILGAGERGVRSGVGSGAASAPLAAVRYAYRHTHYRDPIPHLPWPSAGFHHVPREVFLREAKWKPDTADAALVCDGSGEDPACSNSLNPMPTTTFHLHYFGRRLGSFGCPRD